MSQQFDKIVPHHDRGNGPEVERCGAKFDTQSGMGGSEIWVPLKA